MLKRLRSIAAVLFVGVFVFALAFTLAASSAHAYIPCCTVYDGEIIVKKGKWDPYPTWCECAPLTNPANCILLCPGGS